MTITETNSDSHELATVTPIAYTTPAFSRLKTETFENTKGCPHSIERRAHRTHIRAPLLWEKGGCCSRHETEVAQKLLRHDRSWYSVQHQGCCLLSGLSQDRQISHDNRQHCAINGDVRGSRNILSHHHCLTEAYGESELCAGSGKIIAHLLNFLFSVSHEGSIVCVEQLAHKDALHPGPQTSQAEEVAITPGVQQNPTRIRKRPSQHSREIGAK